MAGTIKSLVGRVLIAAALCSPLALAQSHSDTQHLYPERTQADWWKVQNADAYTAASPIYDVYELDDAFGGDQAAILNQLGAPKQRYEWQAENRHEDGVMNTFVTLVYDGLVIELVELKHKTFITRVFIENCGLKSPFQHYLCKPVSEVVNQLGEPTAVRDDEIIYTVSHGDIGSKPLRLGTQDDNITWIYISTLID